MCGRYYIDDDTTKEIEKLLKNLDEQIRNMKTGEICPTQKAPVITGKTKKPYGEQAAGAEPSAQIHAEAGAEFSAELCIWGFPSWTKNGVIFNARSETVFEKRMFRECIRTKRCAVPASRFYEWNGNKERFTFTREDGELLYLAGCYEQFDGEDRFVILTTEADEVMQPVHDRMPVVLKKEQLADWIYDERAAEAILQQKVPPLKKETEYEQQSLF